MNNHPAHRQRAIVHRTSGHSGGPITRLVSPSDAAAALVKPFVFLDRFEGRFEPAMSIDNGWHPHSGIATVTVVLDGAARYADTTGATGTLPVGSVEWMRAGLGVWHTGGGAPGLVRGFQLWVALPPELENAASESHYVMPEQIATEGPARVVLGHYGRASSPINAPPMTYLSVSLTMGQRWTFEPPEGHDVAWVALMDGALETPDRIAAGEFAAFERAAAPIEFTAVADTRFVLGSARQHPHPLVLGSYSVHTSRDALNRGQAEIRRIGHTLIAQGKISYALRNLD